MGPASVAEIAAAAASPPANPARRRHDPDRVAPCAQPIPCRGLESTAARGERRAGQAGPRGASQPTGRAGGARHSGGREACPAAAFAEDLHDQDRILDAGDDAHRPAIHRAGLDVDAEHALQALRPSHRRPALGRGPVVCLGRCFASSALAPPGLGHLEPVGRCSGPTRRGKRVRFTRGSGTSAASRARKSSGSKSTCVVPSE